MLQLTQDTAGRGGDNRTGRRPPCWPSDVFLLAVEDHEPVGTLENIRANEYFYWENDPADWCYSPSDALACAVIHNHGQYAGYLLSQFPEDSLKVPGMKAMKSPIYAFHLGLAVTYNRRDILMMIIKTTRKIAHLHPYINHKNYLYPPDGKTPLLLACELLRPDLVLILLCNGASPTVPNSLGQTPLDVALSQVRSSRGGGKAALQCLDCLLLFAPPVRFSLAGSLQENPESWLPAVGEDVRRYLLGETPAPLQIIAKRRVLRCLDPERLLSSVQQLRIPRNLIPGADLPAATRPLRSPVRPAEEDPTHSNLLPIL